MLFRKDGHNVGSKMRLESCTVLLINTAEIVGIDMRFGCASVCGPDWGVEKKFGLLY